MTPSTSASAKRWAVILGKTLVRLVRRVTGRQRPQDVPVMLVHTSAEQLRQDLGTQYFSPGWLVSYHYYGELVNARRVFFDAQKTPVPWRQVHVRAFDVGNGWLELQPHTEAAPLRHPVAHAEKRGVSTARGVEELARALDGTGHDFRVIHDRKP
jgi:hypothetical protein